MIVSNLNYEKCHSILKLIQSSIDINQILSILSSFEESEKIDDKKFDSLLEFWNNCLTQPSLTLLIPSQFCTSLYQSLTSLNLQNPLKLTLNQKRLVISLITKLTIGFPLRESSLALQIISDLDQLQNKKDIEFVNNILTPLLKAEHKVPVSFDFFDFSRQSYLSFGKLEKEYADGQRFDNFLSRPELTEISQQFEKHVGEHYNGHKMVISKWKLIHSFSGQKNAASFTDLLRKMDSKVCFFILVEGYSPNLHSKCRFGVYNRNAIYQKADKFKIVSSKDNFSFAASERFGSL
jgi:hypothetical protein